MKKIILTILSICLVFTMFNFCFAARFEKTGEYYRYFEDDGSVARDKIVEVDRKKYYLNDDGYAVFNSWVEYEGDMYYAGNDAVLKTDGAYDIEGYKYYLDSEGKLRKGWTDDYLYYGDLEDGFLINGFQELDIPKGWPTDNNKEKTAWFYFDVTTNKRVFATDDHEYMCKVIGSRRYCFDQNGILKTGWRLIKDTEPAMKGYMYFVEESNDDFKFGEAVTDSWYAVEPPVEVLPGKEVRYFYFNDIGQPRTAPAGKYQKVRVDNKTYLFNEFGYAVYGVHELNGDYYYFGPSVQDCSMKTGIIKKSVDETNDGASFFFDDDGKGYTGIRNNKLYYKGKIQKAPSGSKITGIDVGGRAYLVNTYGAVLRNKKKMKDSDGCEWSSSSTGVVTHRDDSVEYTPAEPPELSEDK